jgi:transposase
MYRRAAGQPSSGRRRSTTGRVVPVAIAALRSPDVRTVTAEDQAAVTKICARRHCDLSRAHNRSRAACTRCSASSFLAVSARKSLQDERIRLSPTSLRSAPPIPARIELAYELLDELRTIADQRRVTKNRITRIVAASKTSITDIYGVGPIVAATVLG